MHDHDLHDDPANSPSARAGLIPPWWDKPRGAAALDREAWFEEQEREAAHALRVPPRARRRREREKRRASRLDGRWHRRAKAQAERDARFDQEVGQDARFIPERWDPISAAREMMFHALSCAALARDHGDTTRAKAWDQIAEESRRQAESHWRW